MSKKNKLFSLTVLASMLAVTGCTPTSASSNTENSQKEVSEAKFVDVEFLDKTVLYDGKVHGLEITGKLPEGVSVTYSDNNAQVNTGDYTITAYFSDNKGTNYQQKEATLHIVDSTGANEIWNNLRFQGNETNFVYDGQEHSLAVDPNTIPEGYEVSRYTNNKAISVGQYPVTVYMRNKASKVEVYSKTTIMNITKADYDMSNVVFKSKQYAYDGKKHELTVEGLTEDIQVVVSYTNNGRTTIGTQEVTASFKSTNLNYKDPAPLTANLTILANAEVVKVNVFAYYNGTNVPVVRPDGTVCNPSDKDYTGYEISLPVGGTLDPNDLPVLAVKKADGTYIPAPKGAYTTENGYDESLVTEVVKQDTAINLSVTYTPRQYTIVYQGTNSKDDSSRPIRYTFDEQLNLPTPNMNDGYEFTGWSYTTNYDVTTDQHYASKPADAVKYHSGTVGIDGVIASKTLVGDLVLTVNSRQIGASASIVDQQVVYNGKQQDITITNKDPKYVYELVYKSANGITESSSPKNVGTYHVTLNVYTDATKKEMAQAPQEAVFTIVKAKLKNLGKKTADNSIVIADGSAGVVPIQNTKGENVQAVFTTSDDTSTAYDLEKNIFTYTYDGLPKEVNIKVSTISGTVLTLRTNQQNNDFPFIPHISYVKVENGVYGSASNDAPTNAGTYEVSVTFSALNSESANYEELVDMKTTLVINKKNVEDAIDTAISEGIANKNTLWKDYNGNSHTNQSPAFSFKYQAGKEYSVYFDIASSNSFPKGVEVDYYSGEKSSTAGTKTARVYFKVTDPNIEVPNYREIQYVITDESTAVLFYDANNLNGNPIASYAVEKGQRSPLPSIKGDESAYYGYDTYYYLYGSYNADTQTGTDATSNLLAVSGDEIRVVVVRKPHTYNIKYVISELADNSMNKTTYTVVDDNDEDHKLKVPTLQDSRFLGWYLDPNFNSSLISNGTYYKNILALKDYRDIVLYAKFETKTPTVFFYTSEDEVGDGGAGTGNAYAQITNTFGEKYILPESNPTREGRVFKYWYIMKDGVKTQVNETLTVYQSIDHAVYAEWEYQEYRVTVTYKKKEAADYIWVESASTFVVKYNSLLNTATNIDTTDKTNVTLNNLLNTVNAAANAMGYDFEGFYYTNGQKVDLKKDIFDYTNNQQISARLKAKNYNIKFVFIKAEKGNVGTKRPYPNFVANKIAADTTITTSTDSLINFPDAALLNRDGYTLTALTKVVPNDDLSVTSVNLEQITNLTQASILTPKLLNSLLGKKGDITIAIEYLSLSYTITFVDEEGKLLNGQNNRPSVGTNNSGTVTVEYKKAVTYPTPVLTNTAKYKGYEFEAWEYEGNNYSGASVYEFSKNITLKLKVKAKSVNVVFYNFGGAEITDLTGIYKNNIGGSYTLPTANPASNGKTFVGWVTKSKYDQVKATAGVNKAQLYYYNKTRNATTLRSEKSYYYNQNGEDFVTTVTPVEQKDFDTTGEGLFALYAVFVDNEYEINIQYTVQDELGNETTKIMKAASPFIKTYNENGISTWDSNIYVEDSVNAGRLIALGIDNTTQKNFLPNRAGYDMTSLTFGTTALFTIPSGKSAFELGYKAKPGDYNPDEAKDISWSTPMSLTAEYRAKVIDSVITTKSKTKVSKPNQTGTRKVIDPTTGAEITKTFTNLTIEETQITNSTTNMNQTYGAKLLLPNDPVLDGYSFKKWVRTDEKGEKYYISSGTGYVEYTVNNDTVVNNYGIYKKVNNNYVLQTIPVGTKVYIFAEYEKSPVNFTFSGLNSDGQRVGVLTNKPDEIVDAEVVEFYKANKFGYQIYIDQTTGNRKFKYFDSSSKKLVEISLPEIKEKNGYNTGKWTVTMEVDDSIYDFNDGNKLVTARKVAKTVDLEDFADQILANDSSISNVSASITYVPKKVEISYYNGNELFTTAEASYSQKFTLPTIEASEGKTFAGWRLIKLKKSGQNFEEVDTETIINSGSVTLDNFNYISIDDKGTTTLADDTYSIRFRAVFVDKSYKIKFNINNITSEYIQDSAGVYDFAITNGTPFYEVLLGSDNDAGLQIKLLQKLGLDPTQFALVIKSQKVKEQGSQKDIYCFADYANGRYTSKAFAAAYTNLDSEEDAYSYSEHGSVFSVGLVYLKNKINTQFFEFTDDAQTKTATLTGLNGNNIATSTNALYKTNGNIWLPSYVMMGDSSESIYKINKVGASFLYNNQNGLEKVKDFAKAITIPDTITEFEKGAFAIMNGSNVAALNIDCPLLTKVNYLGTVASWNNIKFNDVSSNPMYLVYQNCFYKNNLQTLQMSWIDSVGTTLQLPKVSIIKKYTFINLSYLNKVIVPANINEFEEDCFKITDDRDCPATGGNYIGVERYATDELLAKSGYFIRQNQLTSVEYESTIENWAHITFGSKYSTPMSLAKFENGDRSTTPIADLKANGNSIRNLDGTSLIEVKDYAFYCVGKLELFTHSSALKTIGKYAFSRTGLKSVSLSSSVENIGEGCFAYNQNLTSVNISSALKKIAIHTFIKYKTKATLSGVETFDITINGTTSDYNQISLDSNYFGFLNSSFPINMVDGAATIQNEMIIRFRLKTNGDNDFKNICSDTELKEDRKGFINCLTGNTGPNA